MRPPLQRVRTRSGRLVVAVLTGALLLPAAACGALDDVAAPSSRDPLTWPYPSDSIWNHPRGDAARLVPFPLAPRSGTLSTEEDLIIIEPDAPGRDLVSTTAGWQPGASRCDEATGEVLAEGLPIPEGWFTDPGYTGRTPNQAAAIVMPDLTVFETQPLHVCQDGTAVSQEAQPDWRGNSIVTGGTAEDPGSGAHGGSGMTAFGGTIRLGEWVPGGQIRHALKITLDASQLSAFAGGYRWPAQNADQYWDGTYVGDVPAARMGALMTLPPWFNLENLQTEPARILAEALMGYGAYIVDDTGWDTVGIAVEWGPQGRVKDEFSEEWGFPIAGHIGNVGGDQLHFLEDLSLIYSVMHVVDDNDPDSLGGAGKPMAPFAPPLDGA